jgi:hypothetical protein
LHIERYEQTPNQTFVCKDLMQQREASGGQYDCDDAVILNNDSFRGQFDMQNPVQRR